jgi:hypothetical protein
MSGKTIDTSASASGPNQPMKYISQALTATWKTITTTFGAARRKSVEAMGASKRRWVWAALGRPMLEQAGWRA